MNPAWERVLGWPRAEMAGRPYLDFVHPDDIPAIRGVADPQRGGAALHEPPPLQVGGL